MTRFSCASLLLLSAAPAIAAPPPDAIRAMIDTALSTKDPATIAAVVSVAKRTAPESADEIDTQVAEYNLHIAAAAQAKAQADRHRLATASVLALWKGEFEVGGSRSTGNSRTLGLYGSVKLHREGLNWDHSFTARADYQETSGDPTTERAVAAYQPHYKLSPHYYVYGLTQYGHDRFLGYRDRITSGFGIGVTAADRPDLKVSFDIGPAHRYTDYYDMENENRLAARGALGIKWVPLPTLTIAQDAAIYFEKGNTTATSTTSIDTLLFGPLKGRLSYNIQYERDAPAGQKQMDTVSRASLVYSF